MAADEVEIVPYQDGPYLVRGPVKLRDQEGGRIEAGRRTIALCRCGKSRTRPFCDGTHQVIRFKVPSGPEGDRSTRSDVGQPQTKPPGPSSGDRTARAQALIRAAIETLVQGAGESREIPKVIEQLAATATLLEGLA